MTVVPTTVTTIELIFFVSLRLLVLFSYPATILAMSLLSAFLRCSTIVDLSTPKCLERTSEVILLGTS